MPPSTSLVKFESRRAVAFWLIACALLVACMVFVGGYTRLSGSGLSITNWKPIHGVIPPLDAAQWEEEFALYKQSPQYLKVNKGMSLEEFKAIFWPEYYHRLLGRAIGFIFFLPLLYFAARRRISKRFCLRMLAIFAFGGLQGFIGWFMVKSGLVDDPRVSHVRLALHLGLAFAIFAMIWWSMLDALSPWAIAHQDRPRMMRGSLALIALLLFIQIIFGAFMAGLHAGLIFNTFPTMNGQWLPQDLLAIRPMWLNAVENITTVQFIHRWLAKLLLALYVFWWWKYRGFVIDKAVKRISHSMLLFIALQFVLGVMTLLLQVPLNFALAHQLTALALFATTLTVLHSLCKSNLQLQLVNSYLK